MNYAEKYIEHLLNQAADAVAAAPLPLIKYDLPGLRTFNQLEEKRRKFVENELQLAKDRLVTVNQRMKSKKYAGVKEDLKNERSYLRDRIKQLQFTLGSAQGDHNAK